MEGAISRLKTCPLWGIHGESMPSPCSVHAAQKLMTLKVPLVRRASSVEGLPLQLPRLTVHIGTLYLTSGSDTTRTTHRMSLQSAYNIRAKASFGRLLKGALRRSEVLDSRLLICGKSTKLLIYTLATVELQQ